MSLSGRERLFAYATNTAESCTQTHLEMDGAAAPSELTVVDDRGVDPAEVCG